MNPQSETPIGRGHAIAFGVRNPKPERILVRGVNWLGDAVMTTPALLRLREAKAAAQITLLTQDKLADLWLGHPALDAILTISTGDTVMQVASRLRSRNFDLALVFPNSPRSALEVWLARIPQRIGYAVQARNLWLTQPVPHPEEDRMRKRTVAEIKTLIEDPRETSAQTIPASAHQVHHYLKLAAVLGANPDPLPPRIGVTGAEVASVCHKFELKPPQQQGGFLFGMNPGAEYGPAKRWPAERFAEAAIELQRRTHCRWVILGGQTDRALARGIAEQIERAAQSDAPRSTVQTPPAPAVFNLAGATTLRELCAILKTCRVLLTNDTGPMHVAAALGTPVVTPFGSTSPELTGPGLPGDSKHQFLKAQVPCSPCFLRGCPIDFRCMTGIPVERVVEAVLKVAAIVA